MSDEINALKAVLSAQPENHEVRKMLASRLVEGGDQYEAVAEYLNLSSAGQLNETETHAAAAVALNAGLGEAAQRILNGGAVSPTSGTNAASAAAPGPAHETEFEREAVMDGPAEIRGSDFIDTDSGVISFADVGGLDDVKKVIDRLIIQPLARPELFAKYGKSAGGGVLLYGPPGCGKTLIARATAGEVGLPFYNLRVEDIVDPYFGVSEQRLAEAFVAARELRPCILFIDELDALGYARSNQRSERARALVEVLLQQLDSIGSDNEGLLILAASNEPWDIDGALMRPGRFDRTIFVPPPDDKARHAILSSRLSRTPNHGIKVKGLVGQTSMFSGADLRELVDRALDEVIEEAIGSGTEPPLSQKHFELALQGGIRATTLPWLHRARNHADFGNIGGRWDDLKAYLKKRAVAKELRNTEPT